MSKILNDAIYSVHTTLSVYVLNMWQWHTNDFFSSSHNPVKLISLFCRTVPKPARDTVCETALDGASIEHGQGWNREIYLLQSSKRMKSLLGPLDYSCCVVTGGQLICQMDPQELDTVSDPRVTLVSSLCTLK